MDPDFHELTVRLISQSELNDLVRDKHGERFQQDISTMEKRYARKSSQNMYAEYCWNLTEDVSIASYKRMSYKKKVLNVSKIKHVFSHFYCVTAWSYFHTSFLPLFLSS